jgi:GDP-D-mannose 3', 5'-epimerase
MRRALVTGAGGFIGAHLVSALKERGYWVRGVDRKRPEFTENVADEYELLDLRDPASCLAATRGVDEVFALAADMGGMGYISRNHAGILRDNTLIDLHTLEAARRNGVSRLLFTSSACVYPEYRQNAADVPALREEEALPAAPQDGYGWEKLMAELACAYYNEEGDIDVRVARLHNVYGPFGTYRGGREKAPAALCRKVAEADDRGYIEIWGDGEQTRSFCFIDDCVEGLCRLMGSDYAQPVNIGSEELISIDSLARLIADVAGKRHLELRHVPGPQGVRGRCSDNTLVRTVLGWEPGTTIREGIEVTYRWVDKMVRGY